MIWNNFPCYWPFASGIPHNISTGLLYRAWEFWLILLSPNYWINRGMVDDWRCHNCSAHQICMRFGLAFLWLYPLRGGTSIRPMFYRKISWSLEAARLVFRLFNRSGIWKAHRQQRCRDACQVTERYIHNNFQSPGFNTSRHLAVKRLIA